MVLPEGVKEGSLIKLPNDRSYYLVNSINHNAPANEERAPDEPPQPNALAYKVSFRDHDNPTLFNVKIKNLNPKPISIHPTETDLIKNFDERQVNAIKSVNKTRNNKENPEYHVPGGKGKKTAHKKKGKKGGRTKRRKLNRMRRT